MRDNLPDIERPVQPLRRNWYRFLAMFMLVLCVFCSVIAWWAVGRAGRLYATETHDQIYAIKKTFLKTTVRNMLRNIEQLRAYNRAGVATRVTRLDRFVRNLWTQSPAQFPELLLSTVRTLDGIESLLVRVDPPGGGDPAFLSPVAGALAPESLEQALKGRDAVDIRAGGWRVRIAVNEAWVEQITKENVAAIIHYQVFEDDAYIWVNEVVDWQGGDNYGIRRIHPNLRDTEGSYISTNLRDIMGNTPYLTELEGVRDQGELFHTYYFKRKDSNEIAAKLSYATLYEPYNWIVAMGMHLPDIDSYVDSVREESRRLSTQVVAVVVASLVVFFLMALLVLYWIERLYFLRASQRIRQVSNLDALTGLPNRRLGEQSLRAAFDRFVQDGTNTTLLFFDIDHFKLINDAFGHEIGDMVLKTVASRSRASLRGSDVLSRWGGEEFLLLCHSVERGAELTLAGKLAASVRCEPIDVGPAAAGDATVEPDSSRAHAMAVHGSAQDAGAFYVQDGRRWIHTSVSVGIARFQAEDSSPADALRRADAAMYRAKEGGRNRACE